MDIVNVGVIKSGDFDSNSRLKLNQKLGLWLTFAKGHH